MNPWRSTVSQEYDHDGNHRIEQRNRRLRESVRTILYDMTGGRLQYQELGPTVKRIASKVRNHIPLAGDKTPVQKAGGIQLDVMQNFEVFGVQVYYHEHVPAREGKLDAPQMAL